MCIYFVDGTNRASEIGDIRALNMFMLGCVSHFLPIAVGIWKECLSRRIPSKTLQINNAAFDQGRKEIVSVAL